MIIGIDFDNTIAGYDRVFAAEAERRGLFTAGMPATKKAIHAHLKGMPDGERQWMAIQGQVYGARINEAVLIEGVADFLRACRARRIDVAIISHKTVYGHFDPARINLRDAARRWMTERGFFDADGFGLDSAALFFEASCEAKVARIAAHGCDVFIDDLEMVLTHPDFPPGTVRHLFHPDPGPLPAGPFTAHRHWAGLSNDILNAA
jgi:hypothetical protein